MTNEHDYEAALEAGRLALAVQGQLHYFDLKEIRYV